MKLVKRLPIAALLLLTACKQEKDAIEKAQICSGLAEFAGSLASNKNAGLNLTEALALGSYLTDNRERSMFISTAKFVYQRNDLGVPTKGDPSGSFSYDIAKTMIMESCDQDFDATMAALGVE